MTGGTAVVLGAIGDNFAAGMTGGMAFVYDADDTFEAHVNPDSVIWRRVTSPYWEQVLRDLVTEHARETNSKYAQTMLSNWDLELPRFWQVCPKEMITRLAHPVEPAAAIAAE